MAVVEDVEGALVFGMVQRAFGLVTLHHRHRLRSEGAAQALEFADQVGDVGGAIGQDQGLEGVEMGQGIFDPEPVPQDCPSRCTLPSPSVVRTISTSST